MRMLLYLKNLHDDITAEEIRFHYKDIHIPAGGIHITRESSVFISFRDLDELTHAFRFDIGNVLGRHITKLLCSEEERDLELKRIEEEAEKRKSHHFTDQFTRDEFEKAYEVKKDDYRSTRHDESASFRIHVSNKQPRDKETDKRHGDTRKIEIVSHSKKDDTLSRKVNDLRETLSAKRNQNREVILNRRDENIVIAIGNPDALEFDDLSPQKYEDTRQRQRSEERHNHVSDSRRTHRRRTRSRSREQEDKRHRSEEKDRYRSRDRDSHSERDSRNRRNKSSDRSRRNRSPDRHKSYHRSRSPERSRSDNKKSGHRNRSRSKSRNREKYTHRDKRSERGKHADDYASKNVEKSFSLTNHQVRSNGYEEHLESNTIIEDRYFILLKKIPVKADIAWVHKFFDQVNFIPDSTKLICNDSGALYAYVEFKSANDQRRACHLDGSKVEKKSVAVKKISTETCLKDIKDVTEIAQTSKLLVIISNGPEETPQEEDRSEMSSQLPVPSQVPALPDQSVQPMFSSSVTHVPPVAGYWYPPPVAALPPPGFQPGFPPGFPMLRPGFTQVPPPGMVMSNHIPPPIPLQQNYSYQSPPVAGPSPLPTQVNSSQQPAPVTAISKSSNIISVPITDFTHSSSPNIKIPTVLTGPDLWVVSVLKNSLQNYSHGKCPYTCMQEFHFMKKTSLNAPTPRIPYIDKNKLECITFLGIPERDEESIKNVVQQLDSAIANITYINIKIEPTGTHWNLVASVLKKVIPALPLFANIKGYICRVNHKSQLGCCILCRYPKHNNINSDCPALTVDKRLPTDLNHVVFHTSQLHPEFGNLFKYNNRYNANVKATFVHPYEDTTNQHANHYQAMYNIYKRLLVIRHGANLTLRKLQVDQDILVAGTDPIITAGITEGSQLISLKSKYVPGLNLAGKALMALRKEMEIKDEENTRFREEERNLLHDKGDRAIETITHHKPGDSFKVTKPFHEIAKINVQADAREKKEEKDMLETGQTSSSFFFSLYDDDL